MKLGVSIPGFIKMAMGLVRKIKNKVKAKQNKTKNYIFQPPLTLQHFLRYQWKSTETFGHVLCSDIVTTLFSLLFSY